MKYERGSFIVVTNAKALKGLHVAAQALYMWLCYHANQSGKCFPSRKRLAALCNVSVDQIDAQMKTLIGAGLVLKESRKSGAKNETNIYSVLLGGVADTNGQGSRYGRPGVADTVGSELNPVITQSTEEILAKKTEKFVSDVKTALSGMSLNKQQVERLRDFVSYWTEPNKSQTKLRWEMQPTWDVKRRLGTWFRRDQEFQSRKAAVNSKQGGIYDI